MTSDLMRKIVHIDMDAFFASVEQRDFPELRGKPVIVGGKPDSRGVVAACSYEARVYGIRSAMPCAQAAKLCKNAVFVPHRFSAYREASRQIHQVFKRYAQAIEPLSLDEAYLDVTTIAEEIGSATQVARLIKQEILRETKLTASAGVSYNKFLAKVASDMDKPDGLFVIPPDKAQSFIESLEIRKFFGVGRVTEKKMHGIGIYNGKDLRSQNLSQLQQHFGRSAQYYYNVARGIDERPVRSERTRKSIGAETTFENNLTDKLKIWNTLLTLSQRVTHSMKSKSVVGRTITLKVKYSDFTQVTRGQTLAQPVRGLDELKDILPVLLQKTEVGVRPIRLIGVTVSNLIEKSPDNEAKTSIEWSSQVQMGLF